MAKPTVPASRSAHSKISVFKKALERALGHSATAIWADVWPGFSSIDIRPDGRRARVVSHRLYDGVPGPERE